MRTAAALLVLSALLGAQNSVFMRDPGSPLAQATDESRAIVVADFDVDGERDVFVANQGDNQLFHTVDGVLVEITTGPIVQDGGKSFSADWGDMDGDGDLDLAVANARDEDNFVYRVFGADVAQSTALVGDPANSDGGDSYDVGWYDVDGDGDHDLLFANRFQANFLYLNDGTGSFTKVLAGDFVTDVMPSRSMGAADLDDDGDRDVFVTTSNNQDNALYINQGGAQGGTVGDLVNTPGGDLTSDGLDTFGHALGDLEKDGDLDVVVTTLDETQPNMIYLNDGDAVFTASIGDAPSQDVAGSFACALGDVDLDADLDLYVTNTDGSNFLYRNDAGTFVRVDFGQPVTDGGDTRGAVVADLDFDGTPDLVVADLEGSNRLYRNLGLQWTTVGPGLAGDVAPFLASESPMVAKSPFALELTGGPPGQPTTLVVGLSLILAPFKGGVLGPAPDVLVGVPTDALGEWTLATTFPDGFPVGTTLFFQTWMSHPSGPSGMLATNSLKGITP